MNFYYTVVIHDRFWWRYVKMAMQCPLVVSFVKIGTVNAIIKKFNEIVTFFYIFGPI